MGHILKCHEIVKTDFVRGENCYLYDSSGSRFIDFESGIWCTALGHSHPRINQVIHSQVGQLIHLGTRYPSYLAEEAAVDVLQIAGLPDGRCVFLSSGSEAVEFGVQIARRMTKKPLLMTLTDSYLAAYGSAGNKQPSEWLIHDWQECANCSRGGDCENCPHLRTIPFEDIGGFVFESGNASGTVKLPPKVLIQAISNRVWLQNSLIMANEITTGMGRTGKWFGFQHYHIQPDIVAIGKGLGNGYPVSAVAMSREVANHLEESRFRYAQSHQNDPLGSAIAKEVIAVMREEKLIERSEQLGVRFLNDLKNLAGRYNIIKAVRGRGLMITVEFERAGEQLSANAVCHQLFLRGFLVGYNPTVNLIRFYPALTINEKEIDCLLGNMEEIFKVLPKREAKGIS